MKKILFLLLIFPSLVFAQTNKKISEMDTLTTLIPSNYWPIVDESEGVPIDRNKRLTYYRLRTTLDSRYIQSSGATYVEAASAFGTDNLMLKSDGTSRGAQATGITISDLNAISGVATIDTGQGANELYDMNQNVQTTDAVTFLTVDTGQGANELYDMDQNVLTTSTVSFGQVAVDNLTINSDDITSTGNIELRPAALSQVFVNSNFSVVGEAAIGNPTYTDPTPGTSYDLKLGGTGNGIAVEGASLFKSGLNVTGAAALSSTLSVTGTTTFSPGATGDATTVFTTDGQSWSAGIDDSFSNAYLISPGSSLGTGSGYLAFFANVGSITASLSGIFGVNASFEGDAVTIHNNTNTTGGVGMEVSAGQDSGDGTLIRFGDGDFTAVGSITFSGATTSYNTSSDRRLKSNIRDSKLNHRFLYSILKDYEWKEDGKSATGVIAQELNEHFPMAVHAPDSGMWSVDYGKLTIPLIQSAEDHEKRISRLETENKVLKKALDRLEARIEVLEKAKK